MAFISSPFVCPPSNLRQTSFLTTRPTSLRIRSAKSQRAIIMTTAVGKGAGMKIIKAANEDTITKMACRSWGTWGCEPSTFPWTYSDDEVCLVLKGDVTVTPDDGGEPMVLQAGDMGYFPKGMSCTWEVREEIQKHFIFGIKL